MVGERCPEPGRRADQQGPAASFRRTDRRRAAVQANTDAAGYTPPNDQSPDSEPAVVPAPREAINEVTDELPTVGGAEAAEHDHPTDPVDGPVDATDEADADEPATEEADTDEPAADEPAA